MWAAPSFSSRDLCLGKLSLQHKSPDCCFLPLVERRLSAPLSHCNHSHHYQKSQMVNSEDGVFVVGTFILMGNSLTASCLFLTEQQRAFRPK